VTLMRGLPALGRLAGRARPFGALFGRDLALAFAFLAMRAAPARTWVPAFDWRALF
jgi:hypothetical protein